MKLAVGKYLNQHCLRNLKSVTNGCDVFRNGYLIAYLQDHLRKLIWTPRCYRAKKLCCRSYTNENCSRFLCHMVLQNVKLFGKPPDDELNGAQIPPCLSFPSARRLCSHLWGIPERQIHNDCGSVVVTCNNHRSFQEVIDCFILDKTLGCGTANNA